MIKTRARARVLMPNRKQMEFRASDLESLLPEGHRARLVWSYVERQNMKGFDRDIRAVEGGVGRAAIAPEILAVRDGRRRGQRTGNRPADGSARRLPLKESFSMTSPLADSAVADSRIRG